MLTHRSISSIFSVMSSKVSDKRIQLESLMQSKHFPVSQNTISELLDGQKGVKSLICETSSVTSSGIKFRGLSLKEVLSDLPGVQKQPSLESLLWLLLTGEVPSYQDFFSFKSDLSTFVLPPSTESLLVSLPKDLHPMTQFSIAVTSLTPLSQYSSKYFSTPRSDHWELMLKDSLFLISVLPKIAALIYRGTFKDGILGSPSHTDLAEDFSRMIGWKDEKFFEALRLFLVIHADHEGSNVSTHAARLVASAGGNVFEAFAAGLNGLAGPSHGMGMQNCLMWLVDLWRALGENIDEKSVEIAVRAFLMKDGKVPGFGHPVLRNVDERFLAQFEFAGKHLKGDPLCEIIRIVSQVTPRVMKEMGMNVLYPNMYLHSAAILFHYGLRMYEYYCVLFGFSRAVGIVSNVVWDVALQLPMEEIQSVTLEELERLS